MDRKTDDTARKDLEAVADLLEKSGGRKKALSAVVFDLTELADGPCSRDEGRLKALSEHVWASIDSDESFWPTMDEVARCIRVIAAGY